MPLGLPAHGDRKKLNATVNQGRESPGCRRLHFPDVAEKNDTMTRYSEESEKAIERHLVARVKTMGGLCLKFHSAVSTGWPDRVVMLPPGIFAWVELKSKGKRPTPLQDKRLGDIRAIGIKAIFCDSRASVDDFIKQLTEP